jgi:drug/metabolite transporter (DMT)-like permease
VILPLAAALASALCYGVASVLQAMGARRTARGGPVDPRLLMRVLREGPFVVGIGLDMVGFAFQFVALRSLPLFLVQAALASNLAVTAVVAVPVLGIRLGAAQWLAVAGVCAGLTLLAVAAGTGSTRPVPLGFRIGLLVVALLLAALGVAAGRVPQRWRGAVLGAVAGLGFAVLALSVRGLSDLHLRPLLTNPASYAVAVSGIVGFLCYASGLQQAGVTTVTGAVVVAETAIPALVGVLALGDHTRHDLAPVAVAGFLLAVAGALGLARFGEIEPERPAPLPGTAA